MGSASHIFVQQGQRASSILGSHPHYEVPAPSPGSLCSCHACPWWSHLVERGGHDVERGGLGLRPLLQPHPHERWRPVWVWRPWNNSPTSTGTFGESPWSRLPHNNNNNCYN